MLESRRLGEALKGRLLLAILGIAAPACRDEAPPPRVTPVETATPPSTASPSTPVETATRPEPSVPPTPPPATASPVPSHPETSEPAPTLPTTKPRPGAASCGPGGSPRESCYAPFANARSTGTGEPAPPPPRTSYDANGCLPSKLVSNGCCNPAIDGPRLKGGQCCYTFCEGSCCGRPFLVNGRARMASLGEREDWLAEDDLASFSLAALAADVALDPSTAHALGEAWLADARMEHASAAAFGRFVMQLVAIGAPPGLVRDAAIAAADEVKHAELCFTLASRIGGVVRGPMPFSLDGALASRSLPDIVADVIVEGCVGETTAAMLATAQLEGARDPAVRQVLERISVDEARHAELAWSFLRWAISVGGEEVRARAASTFAHALLGTVVSVDTDAGFVDASAWRAFGRLSPGEVAEARLRVLVEIVAPCADALLGADFAVRDAATHDAFVG